MQSYAVLVALLVASCRAAHAEQDADGLTELHIAEHAANTIGKQDMQNYTNLEVLNISTNKIEYIEIDAFESNTKLRVLNLSETALQLPSTGPIFKSESLKTLVFSSANLVEISDEMMDGLPNLETLDISSNLLGNVSMRALQKTSKLKTLILSKDGRFTPSDICKQTTIETIILKIEDEDDEQVECKSFRSVTHEKNVSGEVKVTTTEKPETQTDTTLVTKEIITTQSETTSEKPTTPEEKPDIKLEDIEKPDIKHEDIEKPIEDNSKLTDVKPEIRGIKPDEKSADDIKKNIYDIASKEPSGLPAEIKKDLIAEKGLDTKKSNLEKQAHNPADNNLASAESTLNETSSGLTGTNVVLGIIVCIAVIGTLSFGYQYWKNHRGYANPNTEDNEDEGKELQTITVTTNHTTDDEDNK